jgi:hypothetical protein
MNTQETLFRDIKEKLPSNLSFVHDISELLGISYDSAYRRIRGEKEISLEEFRKICTYYHLSADTLFNLDTGSMIFTSRAIGRRGMTFEAWLNLIVDEVKNFHACKEKEMIYAAKDIPLFHFFDFPEIAAFKIYFWHKALFPMREADDTPFEFTIPEGIVNQGKLLMSLYRTSPTIELWNEETVTSILRQINYCFLSGFFRSKDDAIRLTEVLETWVRHVQNQAEHGFRFAYGSTPDGIPDSFRLYYNEVLLTDNTIFVRMDHARITYMTYNIINLLVTSNPEFCAQIEETLRILMQKSTLISGTSAKERNHFFNCLVERIRKTRDRLSMD